MRILREMKAIENVRTRQSGGATQTFYRSNVAEDEAVNLILKEKEIADEHGSWPMRNADSN